MDEARVRHLELVQGVVSRMALNSFLLKGWAVTLTAGLAAVSAASALPLILYLALLPIAAFWALDGYYLWQERRFRALYDAIRDEPPVVPIFSMNTRLAPTRPGYLAATLAPTIAVFYGSLVAAIAVSSIIASFS